MRIIDKNIDFYDYLQDSTDTIVFDRRNSFLLTKQMLCDFMYKTRFDNLKYRFLLLQCGGTFWLFLITITEFDKWEYAKNYVIETLSFWKNYDKPNKLLDISLIEFIHLYKYYNCKNHDFNIELMKKNIKDFTDEIDRNNFRIISNFNYKEKWIDYKNSFKKEVQTIPLLKACGIGNIVEPQTIFCAIEEYFSIEKQKLETTEPKGVTNNDKIITHGFDTKISFRN